MNKSNIRAALSCLYNWDRALARGSQNVIKFDIRMMMNSSKTVGCAAGYLGLQPSMHKRGLRYDEKIQDFFVKGEHYEVYHHAFWDFFELEYDERALTDAFTCSKPFKRPREVAAHIEAFLKEHKS